MSLLKMMILACLLLSLVNSSGEKKENNIKAKFRSAFCNDVEGDEETEFQVPQSHKKRFNTCKKKEKSDIKMRTKTKNFANDIDPEVMENEYKVVPITRSVTHGSSSTDVDSNTEEMEDDREEMDDINLQEMEDIPEEKITNELKLVPTNNAYAIFGRLFKLNSNLGPSKLIASKLILAPNAAAKHFAKLFNRDFSKFLDARDLHNFALTSKTNYNTAKKFLENEKRDLKDPIRHMMKFICPPFLKYLDGDELNTFTAQERERLFHFVKDFFKIGEDVEITHTTIESIVKENAQDLVEYIKNGTKFVPTKHYYDLYKKFVYQLKCPKQRPDPHVGFAHEHEENLPIGTYYANHDCENFGKGKGHFNDFGKCVLACKMDANCNACTLASGLNSYTKMMNPEKCKLRNTRATYSIFAVWIKDDPNALPLMKEENTELQHLVRCSRELEKLWVDTYNRTPQRY